MNRSAFILTVLFCAVLIGVGISWYVYSQPGDNYSTTTAEKSMSTWQTYTNQEFGYSVKYPPNWHFEERLEKDGKISNVWFGEIGRQYEYEGLADDFVIVVSSSPTDLPGKLPTEEFVRRRVLDGASVEEIQIDGEKAIKLTGGLSGDTVEFAYKGDDYSISISTRGHYNEVHTVFLGMMTTFRLKRE